MTIQEVEDLNILINEIKSLEEAREELKNTLNIIKENKVTDGVNFIFGLGTIENSKKGTYLSSDFIKMLFLKDKISVNDEVLLLITGVLKKVEKELKFKNKVLKEK